MTPIDLMDYLHKMLSATSSCSLCSADFLDLFVPRIALAQHQAFAVESLYLERPSSSPRLLSIGAVHKVRHARGGWRGSEVRQFVTGGRGGKQHVTSHLYIFFIIHMKHEI